MEDKKNILLIGANQPIGKQTVVQGIKQFFVHCLMDTPPNFGINSIFLKFVQGNFNTAPEAFQGKDAVISVYQAKAGDSQTAISDYTHALINAMKQKNVNKLIFVGCWGSLPLKNGQIYHTTKEYPQENQSRAKDNYKALQLIKDSGLQYTILCADKIINDDKEVNSKCIEQIQDTTGHVHIKGLAALLVKSAAEGVLSKKIVGVVDVE